MEYTGIPVVVLTARTVFSRQDMEGAASV